MWKTLGAIRPCEAPKCDIRTNKRYHKDFRQVVACCPKHATTALELAAAHERELALPQAA